MQSPGLKRSGWVKTHVKVIRDIIPFNLVDSADQLNIHSAMFTDSENVGGSKKCTVCGGFWEIRAKSEENLPKHLGVIGHCVSVSPSFTQSHDWVVKTSWTSRHWHRCGRTSWQAWHIGPGKARHSNESEFNDLFPKFNIWSDVGLDLFSDRILNQALNWVWCENVPQ